MCRDAAMKYSSSRWYPLRAANASSSTTAPAAMPTSGPTAKPGTSTTSASRVSAGASTRLRGDRGGDVAEELRARQHRVGAGRARGGRARLVDVRAEAHEPGRERDGAHRGDLRTEPRQVDD